jgi:glycosyltransferase involved in cell wall biosynthesis
MLDAPSGSRPALLVFAEDWGRHISSAQHLIRHLLDRHEVYWVNTIGTRRPAWNLRTVSRGLEKFRQWLRVPGSSTPRAANPRVLSPVMWPWFSTSLDRKLNRSLLLRQLKPVVASLPEPPVAITKLPIVADLMGSLPVRHWVYFCVDDFGEWPGLDRPTLGRMEELVLERADRVLTVSEVLRQRLARMGRQAPVLTHGVDVVFWKKAADGDSLPGVAGRERPLVVFWGVIDRRMDVAFVRQLAEEMTEGTIVLAGPEADPDPALTRCPRVIRLGPVPFAQLPCLAREAAVLVMPYADLPVTRAMQPLKLKEYLATGKPVVARDLPATRDWADCLDLADTPGAFARAVRMRLATGLPPGQEVARGRLEGESWAEKARVFASWALDADPKLL